MPIGSGQRARVATTVDEYRRVMAVWIALEGGFASRVEQVAQTIAKLRRRAPQSLRDFKVLHGGNSLPPYRYEVIVVVEINDIPDDQMNFEPFVDLIERELGMVFRSVKYPFDSERSPYDLLINHQSFGWTEVS
jgi:hypothetical protein